MKTHTNTNSFRNEKYNSFVTFEKNHTEFVHSYKSMSRSILPFDVFLRTGKLWKFSKFYAEKTAQQSIVVTTELDPLKQIDSTVMKIELFLKSFVRFAIYLNYFWIAHET